MCVIYWASSAAPGDCEALAAHPEYALLLACNRDEFFDRCARPCCATVVVRPYEYAT
jgi:uncharacterized protein with NRDE domain